MANFLGLTRSLCPSMVVSLASFGKNSQSRTLPVLAAVAVCPVRRFHPPSTHKATCCDPIHSGPIRGACVVPQLVLNLTPSSKNRVGGKPVSPRRHLPLR